jgi:hypothetical protein
VAADGQEASGSPAGTCRMHDMEGHRRGIIQGLDRCDMRMRSRE